MAGGAFDRAPVRLRSTARFRAPASTHRPPPQRASRPSVSPGSDAPQSSSHTPLQRVPSVSHSRRTAASTSVRFDAAGAPGFVPAFAGRFAASHRIRHRNGRRSGRANRPAVRPRVHHPPAGIGIGQANLPDPAFTGSASLPLSRSCPETGSGAHGLPSCSPEIQSRQGTVPWACAVRHWFHDRRTPAPSQAGAAKRGQKEVHKISTRKSAFVWINVERRAPGGKKPGLPETSRALCCPCSTRLNPPYSRGHLAA